MPIQKLFVIKKMNVQPLYLFFLLPSKSFLTFLNYSHQTYDTIDGTDCFIYKSTVY